MCSMLQTKKRKRRPLRATWAWRTTTLWSLKPPHTHMTRQREESRMREKSLSFAADKRQKKNLTPDGQMRPIFELGPGHLSRVESERWIRLLNNISLLLLLGWVSFPALKCRIRHPRIPLVLLSRADVSEISITQFKNGINNSEKQNTNNSIRHERKRKRFFIGGETRGVH